jgi:hypothetical protein
VNARLWPHHASRVRHSSSGSLAMLAAIRPALVAGERPLCKRLRKWQIFRPGRSAKLLCRIRLQSCETLPEGWACSSTDRPLATTWMHSKSRSRSRTKKQKEDPLVQKMLGLERSIECKK